MEQQKDHGCRKQAWISREEPHDFVEAAIEQRKRSFEETKFIIEERVVLTENKYRGTANKRTNYKKRKVKAQLYRGKI